MRGFAITRKWTPPDDDVCPVCLDDFVLPCRADCNHWFCGACILRVWSFSSVIQPCKCPMCYRLIKSLKPDALMLHKADKEEATKILKSLKRYNGLYAGGVRGFVQKLYDAPFFYGTLIREMTDPDQIHMHVHSWGNLTFWLGLFYMMSPYGFLLPGLYSIYTLLVNVKIHDSQLLWDSGAILGLVLIKLVGVHILCCFGGVLIVLFIHYVGVFQRRRSAERVRMAALAN